MIPTIVLSQCQRCLLTWIPDGFEKQCPRCWVVFGRKTEIVAGYEVEVEKLVIEGSDIGLRDPRVRRGLDKLYLGERCEHGFLTFRICHDCYRKK